MSDSIKRIGTWAKSHPWMVALLLGAVAVAAFLYLRSKSSTTTVSQTPSTTDAGAAGAAATDQGTLPTPTPIPTPVPVPLPVPYGTDYGGGGGGHRGGGGGGGGGTASAGGLPASTLTQPSAFQPATTTNPVIPGGYTVLGSEIVAVTNPAEYSAGAVMTSSHLSQASIVALTGGGGENVSAGRRTVDTSALALKPGYQSRLAAEYGVKLPTGRTAAVIGTATLPKTAINKIAGVSATVDINKFKTGGSTAPSTKVTVGTGRKNIVR